MMLSSQKCMCSKMLSSRNEPPEYFRKILFHKSFPKHALFSDRKLALYVGASISWSFRKCQKCQVRNLRHTVNVGICVYYIIYIYIYIYMKWWFQDFSKEISSISPNLSFCRIGSVWSVAGVTLEPSPWHGLSCCWGCSQLQPRQQLRSAWDLTRAMPKRSVWMAATWPKGLPSGND